ncbi:MAG: hypothetical protein AAGF12_16925, partial [Myxococcota bacterium]
PSPVVAVQTPIAASVPMTPAAPPLLPAAPSRFPRVSADRPEALWLFAGVLGTLSVGFVAVLAVLAVRYWNRPPAVVLPAAPIVEPVSQPAPAGPEIHSGETLPDRQDSPAVAEPAATEVQDEPPHLEDEPASELVANPEPWKREPWLEVEPWGDEEPAEPFEQAFRPFLPDMDRCRGPVVKTVELTVQIGSQGQVMAAIGPAGDDDPAIECVADAIRPARVLPVPRRLAYLRVFLPPAE